MWKLALNNLWCRDFDTSIPKWERKAHEKRLGREKRFWQKCNAAQRIRGTKREVQLRLEMDSLRPFTPWTRFITRDDGESAGEILTVWEVVRQEWGALLLRTVYEECVWLYDDTKENIYRFDVQWLRENIIAIARSDLTWILDLLPYDSWATSDKKNTWNITLQWMNTLMVSSQCIPRRHAISVAALASLFLQTDHSSDILENTSSKIKIRWFWYEKRYSYKNNTLYPGPYITLGEWFWISQKYEYILKEIFKSFYGKRIRITYDWVLFHEGSWNDDATEFPEQAIVGIIDAIERVDATWKPSEKGRLRLFLKDALQGDSVVSCLPDEAFFTGFTIGLLED